MDWIKIKPQHVLFTNLTMTEKGMLLTIQSLAAHLERTPTESEILNLPGIGRKAFGKLTVSLRNIDGSVSEVLRKVHEDVVKFKREKNAARKRKEKSRLKSTNVTRDTVVTSQGRHKPLSRSCHKQDKIREEKERDDNNFLQKSSSSQRKHPCPDPSRGVPADPDDDFFKNNFSEEGKPDREDLEKKQLSPEVSSVLDQLIQLKLKGPGAEKILNPDAYRGTLERKFSDDPSQLDSWKRQIEAMKPRDPIRRHNPVLEKMATDREAAEDQKRIVDEKYAQITSTMTEFEVDSIRTQSIELLTIETGRDKHFEFNIKSRVIQLVEEASEKVGEAA